MGLRACRCSSASQIFAGGASRRHQPLSSLSHIGSRKSQLPLHLSRDVLEHSLRLARAQVGCQSRPALASLEQKVRRLNAAAALAATRLSTVLVPSLKLTFTHILNRLPALAPEKTWCLFTLVGTFCCGCPSCKWGCKRVASRRSSAASAARALQTRRRSDEHRGLSGTGRGSGGGLGRVSRREARRSAPPSGGAVSEGCSARAELGAAWHRAVCASCRGTSARQGTAVGARDDGAGADAAAAGERRGAAVAPRGRRDDRPVGLTRQHLTGPGPTHSRSTQR